MNIREVAVGFLSTAAIVLVVSLSVTALYNVLVHGGGGVDWETSIRLALIFGITFPVIRAVEARKKP
jgi:hypothetical protein